MSEPVFVIATDLRPGEAAWELVNAQVVDLHGSLASSLGLMPIVDLACLPTQVGSGPYDLQLGQVIDRHARGGATELFVMPTPLELNIWHRSMLGEELTEARRRHPKVSIHHDVVDPTHPLLLDIFTGMALHGLRGAGIAPVRAGLLLVANGQGDPGTRADSYRLMRLLWELSGVGRAEVGFIKHTCLFLREVLERCLSDSLTWVLVPQSHWEGDLCEYARVMLADHQRTHPEATEWFMVDPPGVHTSITGWYEQRVRRLWQEKRARQAVRVTSVGNIPDVAPSEVWSGANWIPPSQMELPISTGWIARARGPNSLAEILALVLPPSERYLVKVTWHGYATGTYTGAAALDRLLSALPGKAVILEGHTSGRNTGGANFDWETNAEPHRAWIRQQEIEYLRRTGLSEVISRHGAQYVNVTESWWDGNCAPAEQIRNFLGGLSLKRPELVEYVPSILMELRGAPMISFARFKGPTRLGISNLFGLIPHPLRTKWHGTSIIDFATVCCDIAHVYGSLFPLFGMVEAFDSAVRWDRKGLYRSRWGNYDLVVTEGIFTVSEGLVGADVLASRLQGQDVGRSGFFDVVRARLRVSSEAESLSLPLKLQTSLV